MNYLSLKSIGLPFEKNKTEFLWHTKHYNKFQMDSRPKFKKQNYKTFRIKSLFGD